MIALGRHLIIELSGCPREILDSQEKIEQVMTDAAIAANTTILKKVFHKFSPQGVTGVIVVSESHISIHTWPELNYAAIDIFTCGQKADPWKAHEVIVRELKPKDVKITEMIRGLQKVNDFSRKAVKL